MKWDINRREEEKPDVPLGHLKQLHHTQIVIPKSGQINLHNQKNMFNNYSHSFVKLTLKELALIADCSFLNLTK